MARASGEWARSGSIPGDKSSDYLLGGFSISLGIGAVVAVSLLGYVRPWRVFVRARGRKGIIMAPGRS